jgi:hypothetical protein
MTVLADLLADCRARSVRLLPDGTDRLTIDGPREVLTSDLIGRLTTHKAEIVAALTGKTRNCGAGILSARVNDRGSTLPALIEWFRNNCARLPVAQFPLGPGRRLTCPATFYASLERGIAAVVSDGRRSMGLETALHDLRRAFELPTNGGNETRGNPTCARLHGTR